MRQTEAKKADASGDPANTIANNSNGDRVQQSDATFDELASKSKCDKSS